MTCHDGFTLNDLVSYNQKHNEANGEDNRDGANDNRSWNCGVEGPTDDPAVEKLRNRQVKNFLTVTLMSLGVPMILMGDEVRHTQGGNNNAYCQDNEISWFDWTRVTKHADVVSLCATADRTATPARRRARTAAREPDDDARPGEQGLAWRETPPAGLERPFPQRGTGGGAKAEGLRFHLILNAYWEPLNFELPKPEGGGSWRRWIDTRPGFAKRHRAVENGAAVSGDTYRVEARSVVMLFAGGEG